MRLPYFLVRPIYYWACRQMVRPPDFTIKPDGRSTYLQRWRVVESPLFGIKVHNILRSDDDRALHDHPWPNLSLILLGSYVEHTIAAGGVSHRRRRIVGDLVFRRACAAHRLELSRNRATVTLFITGPRIREWGFYCPNGWRHWREFSGQGCD